MAIITTTLPLQSGIKTIPITQSVRRKTAMMKNYHTAIVTGASHGIGPYIVRALAQEGMNLVLAARSICELEQVATAADMRATGVHVLTVPIDVTDREARNALVHTAERTFGSVDVLVNNAGGDLQREFHHYTTDDVEALIQLNLTGPIELTRLLLPGMLRRKQGHIVNISSMGVVSAFRIPKSIRLRKMVLSVLPVCCEPITKSLESAVPCSSLAP
jgi:short-subunit dehydrogenase